MRHPSLIAALLKKVVPEEAKENLVYFENDFKKRPADAMEMCYEVLQTFLYKIIGPIPCEEWHMKALSILTNTDIEEIEKFAKELQNKTKEIEEEEIKE